MQDTFRPRRHDDLTPSEARSLDRLVYGLARAEGHHRLLIGEHLSWMDRIGVPTKLGFSDTTTYSYEIVEQRRRWCDDTRRLAKRVAPFVLLRDAIIAGEISFSKAEIIIRKITEENEAALVAEAKTKTVRELRKANKIEPEQPSERCTIAPTVERTDAWFLQATRMLMSAVANTSSPDELAEALLAEGLTRLIADVPKLQLPNIAAAEARLTKLRAQMSVTIEQREAERDKARERREEEWSCEITRAHNDQWSRNSGVLHDQLCRMMRCYTEGELRLAQAVRSLSISAPWDLLGFESMVHYGRERLGMSESTMRARIELAGYCRAMPSIEEALLDGRIGLEAARMVGRIAEPDTVDAWVERASQRTLKFLRQDVGAAELLSGILNDRRLAGPPDAEALETVVELERQVLSHAVGAQMSVTASEAEVPRNEPRVMVKLSMREDLARYWRAMEIVYRRNVKSAEPFVIFLCRCAWESWGEIAKNVGYYEYVDVYLRERFRCACPVCDRSEVTAHHIIFRGQGGGNERTNLAAVCSRCHLEGIHRGTLSVSGEAPNNLRWELADGRIVIEGRKKTVMARN